MSNRFLDRGMSFIRNFGGTAEGKDAAPGGGGGGGGGRPAAAASTPPRDSVDDLSRDELLQLCIKLKKRMRALEAKHREVVRSHRSVIRTLADLQHLTLDVCGIPAASVTDDKTGFVHVASLQAAWRTKDAARRDHADGVVKKLQFQLQQAKADAAQQRTASSRRIVELQDKLAAVRAARVAPPVANGSTATRQRSDGASATAEQGGRSEDSGDGGTGAVDEAGAGDAREDGAGGKEDLQRVVDELRIDLQLQKKWAAEHETAWEEENESLRSTLSDRERRIAHLQRAAASDAEALESAKANLEEARTKHRKSVSELEQLRTALELANGARDELEVTTRMDLARFKKDAAESAAKVQQLTASLREATTKAQRCEELSRQVASLQSELNNSTLLNAEKRLVMDELRAQIAATKASEERRAEIAIAKAEDEAAAARAELAEFKAIATSFGGARAANGGGIAGTPSAGAPAAGSGGGSGGGGRAAPVAMVPASQLQEVKALNEELEAAMKVLNDELSRRVAAAEATAAASKAAKTRLQEEIEMATRAKDEADAAHRAALRAARAEASAKSLRARQLIQDKDQEIAALRAKVKELTEDVESGAPTERRLIALAEETAKRDAQSAQQKARIGDLSARLQAAVERADRLDREVQALRRAASMVGPNLEYLKNVVLRYMSFEAGSAEKRSLVPVIATLLKFSRAEVAQVSKSRGFSLFTFGSKPKPVLPPGHPPTMPAGGGAGGAGAGAGIAATGIAGTAALSRGVAGSTVVTVPPSPPTGVR